SVLYSMSSMSDLNGRGGPSRPSLPEEARSGSLQPGSLCALLSPPLFFLDPVESTPPLSLWAAMVDDVYLVDYAVVKSFRRRGDGGFIFAARGNQGLPPLFEGA
ncbi:hypothetical protein GOP47_0005617, partial [Adiantum capillus-veneris]